jgi:hypothetical protein
MQAPTCFGTHVPCGQLYSDLLYIKLEQRVDVLKVLAVPLCN